MRKDSNRGPGGERQGNKLLDNHSPNKHNQKMIMFCQASRSQFIHVVFMQILILKLQLFAGSLYRIVIILVLKEHVALDRTSWSIKSV